MAHFSASPISQVSQHNVQFDLEEGRSPIATGHLRPPSLRSGPEPDTSNGLPAPILKRRNTRSATVTSFRTVDNNPLRPNWHPGQEPGLDRTSLSPLRICLYNLEPVSVPPPTSWMTSLKFATVESVLFQ